MLSAGNCSWRILRVISSSRSPRFRQSFGANLRGGCDVKALGFGSKGDLNSWTNWNLQWRKGLCQSGEEIRAREMEFQDLFSEARLAIGDAQDSMDSVYFDEDVRDAEIAVKECHQSYNALLKELDSDDRGRFERENGQKVRQLGAELNAVMNH